MILYTVLSDPREDANNIIVTTESKILALDTVIDYLRKYNVGDDDHWKNEEEFEAEIDSYESIEDFVLYFANNSWIDSPAYVQYELNQITEPIH